MTLKTKHKILLASLAFRAVRLTRKFARKKLEGEFKRNSFHWKLDLREVVDFMIYISGGFESYLSRFIRRNVKPGDVVMDIGANIGAHTLTMGQSVGTNGKAYAIEATEYAFNKLLANIALNPSIAEQIHPCHCVLEGADIKQQHSVHIHSSWPFESSEERHPSHQGILKSLGDARHSTLDQLVASEGITRLDLVKLDVDGHEWDVLSGGIHTFGQLRPVILMELAPDYNDSEHDRAFHNIHQFLLDLGYQFYDFSGKKLPTDVSELTAMIPTGASRNVVVVPQDSCTLVYN